MQGDGTLIDRNGVWYMRFRRGDKEHRISTKLRVRDDSKKQAKEMLADELKKWADGKFLDADQRRVTVGDLVTDLLAHYDAQGQSLRHRDCEIHWRRHLSPFFADVKVKSVTSALLNKYRSLRKDHGAPQTTVNRELQTLRRAFRHAVRAGKIRELPWFPMAEEKNARKRFYSSEEVQKLRDAAPLLSKLAETTAQRH